MHMKSGGLVLLAWLFSIVGGSLANTWYVSQTSPQDGPGTSWTNAFHVLQDGVDAAFIGDTVLVTNGIYDIGGAIVSNMPNRVAITKVVTVQSVNGPEETLIVGEGPIGSNAVRCAYLSAGAELIGFTLTNGHTYADGDLHWRSGGGVLSYGIIDNCNIVGCSVTNSGGGGVACYDGGILTNSIVYSCASYDGWGGGVNCGNGVVADCTVEGNFSASSSGGVLLAGSAVVASCIINSNSTLGFGGGVHCEQGGTITNCTISSNSAATGGGGVSTHDGGVINNCTITSNSAPYAGGINFFLGGIVSGSTISGNSAANGAGINCAQGGTVTNCIVSSNVAARSGGGIQCYFGRIADCVIISNSARYGGGIRLAEGGLLSGNSIVSYNLASEAGGGVYCDQGGSLSNCTISSNSAINDGGGIYCYRGGELEGCILNHNTASDGGGFYADRGGLIKRSSLFSNIGDYGGGIYFRKGGTTENCTVYSNSATLYGGGIFFEEGGTALHCSISQNSSDDSGGGVYVQAVGALTNCIVWNNAPGENWSGTGSWVNNCTTPTKGINCVTSDPLFLTMNDTYRLHHLSPCIESGVAIGGNVDDVEGTPRPLDGDNNGSAIPDIGAYEYLNVAADSDNDSLTDGDELNLFGTNPTLLNTDADPYSDYEEYIADTDGANPDDWFRILEINGATVSFQSSANRQYTLYWSTDLAEGFWSRVQSQTNIMGSGGVDTLTDAYNEFFIDPATFYRVEVEIP